MPARQMAHAAAPVVDAVYVPAIQVVHVAMLVAPGRLLNLPGRHCVQPVVPNFSPLYSPAAHAEHPAGELLKAPTPHEVQDSAPAVLLLYSPNLHVVQPPGSVVSELYVPGTQTVQDDAPVERLLYEPYVQVVHTPDEFADAAVL